MVIFLDYRSRRGYNRLLSKYSFCRRLLVKTSDDTLKAEDVALGYKQLVDIESAFRTIKQELEIRPIYHRLEDRIRAHILLCWLALLLVRVTENDTGMTWKRIRHELGKIQVGEFIFDSGQVYQCTELTNKQLQILNTMGVDRPSRYPEINSKT